MYDITIVIVVVIERPIRIKTVSDIPLVRLPDSIVHPHLVVRQIIPAKKGFDHPGEQQPVVKPRTDLPSAHQGRHHLSADGSIQMLPQPGAADKGIRKKS